MRTDQTHGQLDLLILGALASSPGHGYDVVVRLRDLSEGEFALAEGTVYPALHRLEANEWLEAEWAKVGERRRRVYRLTPSGRERLADQRRSWSRFTASVNRVLMEAS